MKVFAEIWIGGNIREELVNGLRDLIDMEKLRLPGDPTRVLGFTFEAILAETDPVSHTLHLQCKDVPWGRFEVLEAWLRKHNIAYTRQTEYNLGVYQRMITHYRPGMEHPVSWACDKDGEPYATLASKNVTEAITCINSVDRKMQGGHIRLAASDLAHAKRLLKDSVLPKVDVLPPLGFIPTPPPTTVSDIIIEISNGEVQSVYSTYPDDNVSVTVVDWDTEDAKGERPLCTDHSVCFIETAEDNLQRIVGHLESPQPNDSLKVKPLVDPYHFETQDV